MNFPSIPPTNSANDANIKSILEWLALAHGRSGNDDSDQLHRQLLLLREAPIPSAQRIKLLDLLYNHAERMVEAELPALREVSLPASRKKRLRVRALLELLAALTQDYFNTLAELFDPLAESSPHPPLTSLRRVMCCIAWQIRINHLVAAPSGLGLWQQLHAAFRSARRLGLAETPGPCGAPSILQIYSNALLSAIAQPASFCAAELSFISDYIEQTGASLELDDNPPLGQTAIFWIDPDKDFPAHALIRRLPPPDTQVLYFSCDGLARTTRKHLSELKHGAHASTLGLPAHSETRAGQGILHRLHRLWGQPAKRRFSRRRQSYRVLFCTGLDSLWRLLKSPETAPPLSEWMVTNESPDGYALMHMAGQARHLEVGDIAAIQPIDERAEAKPVWHICVVRWALSENPEHIELGLQVLASQAAAAEIFQPGQPTAASIAALLLPETPPLRHSPALIVPGDTLGDTNHKLIVVVEKDNLAIHEVRVTRLEEQTNGIEVFSVSPDETP